MLQKLLLILSFLVAGILSTNAQNETDYHPISSEIIIDILSTPTPLETPILVKEIDGKFRKELLNDPKNVSNYVSSFKSAVNFGVYGMDLAYANLYGQNTADYLNSFYQLTQNLNARDLIDSTSLERILKTEDNVDSLFLLTGQNMESMATTFQDERRENLSVLMVAGGLIEELYLTSEIYNATKSEELRKKIGEQKIQLEQIYLVLDLYSSRPNFSALNKDLNLLIQAYSNVQITITKGEPIMVEENGELLIKQETTAEVEISDEDAQEIGRIVKLIRTKFVR